MNCLVVVNALAGKACCVNLHSVIKKHTKTGDKVTVKYIDNVEYVWNADGFEKVIVCGGDGTLFNALNLCDATKSVRQLVYVASGTLNESFHTQHNGRDFCIGKVNGRSFSYVCATGSFCQIGYNTSTHNKKRFRVLAYFSKVLKYFNVHQIDAKIDINGKHFDKKYTLVMVLHSQRCFGFNFNKLHKKHPNKLFLLAVKSFGKDNFWHRVGLFFVFFKIFFLGMKKPVDSDRIFFDSFDTAFVKFEKPQTMCIDGERLNACTHMHLCTAKPTFLLTIDS